MKTFQEQQFIVHVSLYYCTHEVVMHPELFGKETWIEACWQHLWWAAEPVQTQNDSTGAHTETRISGTGSSRNQVLCRPQ